MKTKLVFKFEKEPVGFGQVFSQNCKFILRNTNGSLSVDYKRNIECCIGSYENLRQEGELIFADIFLMEKYSSMEDNLEYTVEGRVLARNFKKEVEEVEIVGVTAIPIPLF